MKKGKNEKSEKKASAGKNAYIEGAGIVEDQPITETEELNHKTKQELMEKRERQVIT